MLSLTKVLIVVKNNNKNITMPYVFIISLLAVLLTPLGSFASEDADPFAFGANVDVEVVEQQENSSDEDMTPINIPSSQPEFDFTPPESSSISEENYINQIKYENNQNQTEENKSAKIDKDQALTETLKKDKVPSQEILPLPKVEGTWVENITSSNPLSILNSDETSTDDVKEEDLSLEGMVNRARNSASTGQGRSNASVFDISGIMLRMNLKQVDETMQNRGFRKIMQKYQIPNFIKWRNEEKCRNDGVVGYERVEACVNDRSKKAGHQYVQTAKYQKFDTKEDIEVTFTSNFTENKVYRIIYKSQAASIRGNSPKAVYMRNIKVYDFWKKINQKYGKPDNKDNVTWGMGGNKPYLKAKTGYLLLEDPMFRELDYTRMSREDQRYMNTDLYSF